MHISKATAGRWINQAREAGYIAYIPVKQDFRQE